MEDPPVLELPASEPLLVRATVLLRHRSAEMFLNRNVATFQDRNVGMFLNNSAGVFLESNVPRSPNRDAPQFQDR